MPRNWKTGRVPRSRMRPAHRSASCRSAAARHANHCVDGGQPRSWRGPYRYRSLPFRLANSIPRPTRASSFRVGHLSSSQLQVRPYKLDHDFSQLMGRFRASLCREQVMPNRSSITSAFQLLIPPRTLARSIRTSAQSSPAVSER